MTEANLIRSLRELAADAGEPSPGLLARIEQKSDRIRLGHGVLGVTLLLILVAVGGLGIATSSRDRAATLQPTHIGAPSPPAPVRPPAGGSKADPKIAPADICADPGPLALVDYLDWPCAAPADAHVEDRVGVILADLKMSYGSIKNPKVRLLADTLQDGSSILGPAATTVEVWDPSDLHSDVLATITSDPRGTSEFSFHNAEVIPSHDPVLVRDSVSSSDGSVLVFARRGITRVVLRTKDGSVGFPTSGGVAALAVGETTLLETSSSVVMDGYANDGRLVGSTPFALAGCSETTTVPCNHFSTEQPHP